MDYLTKYGKLSDLSVTYFVIGPRSAWDQVIVGPFRTKEQADANQGYNKGIVSERKVTGLQALEVLEILDREGL